MADGMFERRIDLAEGLLHAVGDEDGIVAETAIAAWREFEMAFHVAFEDFGAAARFGQRQRADEPRGIVVSVLGGELVAHALHRDLEIAMLAGPARGIDSRRAIERRHGEAGIVG